MSVGGGGVFVVMRWHLTVMAVVCLGMLLATTSSRKKKNKLFRPCDSLGEEYLGEII